jgi:hypothetical protein
MKRLALGALLVALAAVVAAGCGGGGSTTLSKEDYATQLDQICADYNAKQKEIGDPASLADVAEKGPKIIDEFDKAIAKAEKLKAPDELKSTRDAFFAKSKQQRDLLEELVAAAKKDDGAMVQEIGTKIDPLKTEVDALGKELGAPACAG